jgi:hypothetical protein
MPPARKNPVSILVTIRTAIIIFFLSFGFFISYLLTCESQVLNIKDELVEKPYGLRYDKKTTSDSKRGSFHVPVHQ